MTDELGQMRLDLFRRKPSRVGRDRRAATLEGVAARCFERGGVWLGVLFLF